MASYLNPMLLPPCVRMLPCLQNPCSSVSYKSLTPLGAPLSVGEGLGVRPYHGSERTKLIH